MEKILEEEDNLKSVSKPDAKKITQINKTQDDKKKSDLYEGLSPDAKNKISEALISFIPTLVGGLAGINQADPNIAKAGMDASTIGQNVLTKGKETEKQAEKEKLTKLEKEKEFELKKSDSEAERKYKTEMLNIARMKAKQGQGQGRQVSGGQIDRLASFRSGLQSLQDLQDRIKAGKDQFGIVEGKKTKLSLLDPESLDLVSTLDAATMAIAKAGQTGVITDKDLEFWKKNTPRVDDPIDVAEAKIQRLLRKNSHDYNIYLDTLERSNHNIAGFSKLETPEIPTFERENEKSFLSKVGNFFSGSGSEAVAAPQKPDFSKMSKEEKKKFLGL